MIQTLNLNETSELPKPTPFFERQFSSLPSRKQIRFDWTFGVILPIVCIAADPFVFRSSIGLTNPGRFWSYKVFAYLLSSVSIMAMAAWLLWGNRLGELRPFLGGLFAVASAVSLLVGFLLVPISLIASVILIGLLGFTPLFSGFVFLRNSVRAVESATEDLSKRYVIGAASLSALYSFVIPYVLNFYR